MRSNYKLALALLAGLLIGIAGAQQAKVPPAYVIAEAEPIDSAAVPALANYGAKIPETLAPFNHHYVVRGGATQSLEGEPPKRMVIIAFDSAVKAREWYDSPAYVSIRPMRQAATRSRVFIVEGVAP